MKHSRKIIFPETSLDYHIQLFWSVNEVYKNLEEHIMPLGRMELLYVEEPYYHINETGVLRKLHGWILMGQRTKVTRIRSLNAIKIFGIRFRPWGIYNLLRIPLHEFKDTVTALSDISPSLELELNEAIKYAVNNSEKYDALHRYFFKKLKMDEPRGMPIIKYTLDAIRTAEEFSVLRHAESTGISHKNINRTFNKYTGLTIKDYHKIFRLRKTLRTLNNGVVPNWAELATANSFYDQAHFIKEFKNYTGCTPYEYLLKRSTQFFGILLE